MRFSGSLLRLSATDLANHLACRHKTQLDLRCARKELKRRFWYDPGVEVLQQKGMEHERSYLDHVRDQGLRVLELPETRDLQATRQALASGAQAISQVWLEDACWNGRADVLLRVPGKSDLGEYHYEVVDTKLSAQTKPGTILQLCLYAEMLGKLQGRRPDRIKVVTPGTGFEPEVYRVDHFEAYYRRVKTRLEEAARNRAGTYPDPCEHCNVCDWWKLCDRQRRDDDHLSLVAGITRGQRSELTGWGIGTLERFGREPLEPGLKPERGSRESLDHSRHQAHVQLKDRTIPPYFEMLPVSEDSGLARLPEPDAGDLFFDIEGDPFAGEAAAGTTAGLEYLFGWAEVPEGRSRGAGEREPVVDPGDGGRAAQGRRLAPDGLESFPQGGSRGGPVYGHLWAHDGPSEKAAFERFIDMVMERREKHPGMHVYHYAPYEPAALKRLMGRYATREQEVDELLRAEAFVDLYRVTRQAVRAGVESYSIKELERFFGYERRVDLREVSRPKRRLEALLETGQGKQAPEEVREIVRGYNEDDCVSTWRLRQWLEELRARQVAEGKEVPRPQPQEGEPGEELTERQQEVEELRRRLIDGVSPLPEERNGEEQGRWLLAYMLDWHWREEKTAWWEFFRLRDLPEDELIDEKAAVAGLEWKEQLPKVGRERNPRYRYSYPEQIVEIGEGAELYEGEGVKLGELVGIDLISRTVDIKQVGGREEDRPRCLYEFGLVRTNVLRDSLMRLGDWVAGNGIDAGDAGSFARAGRDLLLRLDPRRTSPGPLRREEESPVDAACRLTGELDGGALPVQGPPGSGKTFTGARMIVELVKRGKRVGVSAVSHKVIDNLLQGAWKAAVEERVKLDCLHKVSELSAEAPEGIEETTSNQRPLEALEAGEANAVGGTAWLWAREEYAGSVDVLFVDEAGQMSLANMLAMSPCARNIVLLGDPQQLEQPQKGSHPEGTDVSALQHVIGEGSVMPDEKGLFLEQTWRLHPEICGFTSRQFYEGQLNSREGMERQAVEGPTKYRGAGLRVEEVDHEGNQGTSPEEVERVAEVVAELTREGVTWRDADGNVKPVRLEDILVVAPYNAQVAELQLKLRPGAKVGTVDRFQGQEAAAVVYSMTTSSPEDAPRGMEFLYSLNRLNVATSRARCVCVLVASPKLFEPECRSVRQMRLANGVCAFSEEAGDR